MVTGVLGLLYTCHQSLSFMCRSAIRSSICLSVISFGALSVPFLFRVASTFLSIGSVQRSYGWQAIISAH